MPSITSVTGVVTVENVDGGQGGGPSPGGEPVFPQFAGLDQQANDQLNSANWGSAYTRLNAQDGDLLMVVISNVSVGDLTPYPTQSGWSTLVATIEGGVGENVSPACTIYYRIVNTATDPTAYDFTWTNTGDCCAMMILVRGVDQSTPFPDSYVRNYGTELPVTCPDITTTSDGMLVLNIATINVKQKNQLGGGYESSTMSTGAATYPYPVDSPGFIMFSRIGTTATGTGSANIRACVNHVRDAGLVEGASWPWGSGSTWQGFAIAIKSASQ